MSRPQSVLFLKLGYSETFHADVSTAPSLGDVFRSTVLLHEFRGDDVTWVTSPACLPLLDGNPFVRRLLTDEPETLAALASERFDVVVNLEKVPEFCRLADSIQAGQRFGFRLDRDGNVAAHPGSEAALHISGSDEVKRSNWRGWSELLYEMIGSRWSGEEYILGYQPKTPVEFDLGFNVHGGKKWPNKAWPLENWKRLEALLGGRHSITHQRCLNDLYGYMDWIHSCRLLVSNDSLGIHLALAMGKKLVVLFGPSPSREIDLWGRGIAILPELQLECIPCFVGTCAYNGRTCLETIRPKTVVSAIDQLLWMDQAQGDAAAAIA